MNITLSKIEKRTTNSNLIRGNSYYHNGKVQHIRVVNKRFARGIVEGAVRNYRVFIVLNDGDFDRGYCSCSYDSAGLCKHKVAVLLTLALQNGQWKKSLWMSPFEKIYLWLNYSIIRSRKAISFLK